MSTSTTYKTKEPAEQASSEMESSSRQLVRSEGPKRKKKTEFDEERKRPIYPWSDSFKDWFKHGILKNYTDEQVESKLLSHLPFYPVSDGKRVAKIIDTKLDDGNYIHEFCIENVECENSDSNEGNEEGVLSKLGLGKSITPPEVTDVVLVHGYAASLGLFIDNFDSLSSIPGVKIHAIDLLGFGFSSRPKFPKLPNNTKEDVYKVEDWFIDSMEEWRIKRNINRFILIGHSFGGYLSCAYAMKYNRKLIDASSKAHNLIDKMILVSPVGVERSKYSLIKNDTDLETRLENQSESQVPLTRELTADQESIVQGTDTQPKVGDDDENARGQRLFHHLWRHHYSPFGIVRNIGPMRSKFISRWTTHRFAHVYYQNPEHFFNVHNYIYRIFNGAGSGEYAITRVLDVGAMARLPLIDRVPQKVVDMKLPTLWLYGDKDWMNDEAGQEITAEINQLAKKTSPPIDSLAQFGYITNAGHHLYLDNPPDFAKVVFKFLGFRK